MFSMKTVLLEIASSSVSKWFIQNSSVLIDFPPKQERASMEILGGFLVKYISTTKLVFSDSAVAEHSDLLRLQVGWPEMQRTSCNWDLVLHTAARFWEPLIIPSEVTAAWALRFRGAELEFGAQKSQDSCDTRSQMSLTAFLWNLTVF